MRKFSRHSLAAFFHQCLNLTSGLLILSFNGAQISFQTPDHPAAGARKAADTPVTNSALRQTLSPLTPARHEIAGDQTQSFIVELSKGQCLRATIDKADLDLQLTAFDPAGNRLREFLSRRYGKLTVSFIAADAGAYRLEVRSFEIGPRLKPYEIRVDDLGQATPQDRQNDHAVQLAAEAEVLKAQWSKGAIRAAIEKFKGAWSVWRLCARRKEAAEALVSIGNCYFALSEYRQALSYFRRASAESLAAGDRQTEIWAMNGMAQVFSYTGEDLQTFVYSRRALARLGNRASQPNVEDRRAEAEALCHLGEAYYLIGNLPKALGLFDDALAIWVELGDRRGQALARLNRGYTLSELGDWQQAGEQHEQALALSLEVGERRGEAWALTAIGGIRSFLRDHSKAFELHRKAEAIFQFIGDRQGEASALIGIARVYEILNELPTAFSYCTSALRIFREIGSPDSEAVSLLYIGQIHRSKKEPDQALNRFRQSLALSRKLRKQRLEAYGLLELADLDQGVRRDRRALKYYRQVLRFYRQTGDRLGQAKTLNRIGNVYLTAANWRRALHYFQQALPITQAVQDRSEEVETRYNLGRAASDGGEMEESLTHVESAVQLIESLRMGVSGPAFRSSYFALARKHYELYIDLLMQKARPGNEFAARAFQASESARARALLDLLAEMKSEIRHGVDFDLLKNERKLEQSLSVKGQYRIQLLNSGGSEKQLAEIANEINLLNAEYNEVQSQIRERSPGYAAIKQPRPPRLQEVQKELPDDGTILLEYFLGAKRSYLWAVTARDFAAYELPGRVQIEAQAREVYRLLTVRQNAADSSYKDHQVQVDEADKQYAERAASLSDLLLGPVSSRLIGDNLLVVADGALHYVPFEALPFPRAAKRKPLSSSDAGAENFAPMVLRYKFVNLPSASALAGIRRAVVTSPRVSKGILVLADPVFEPDDPRVGSGKTVASREPFAEDAQSDLRSVLRDALGNADRRGLTRLPATLDEAKAIADVAPNGHCVMVTGFDASRARVMSDDLRQFQIVHFATHGLIHSEHPELSGIVLSLMDNQGNHKDGFLQLHDIYNLRLSAELVALSACQTGLGKEVSGEGIVGLTHGFMYAGAKRVLASLWKVDDRATAELMRRFYHALLVEKKPPAAALRAAKMAMLEEKRWQAPFYWAAFIFQGDPAGGPILPADPWYKNSAPALIIFAILILLAGYALRQFKKQGRKGDISGAGE